MSMKHGFTHFRVGHAGAAHKQNSQKRDGCAGGSGFYKGPNAGDTVKAEDKLSISWDPSCLASGTKQVDIYLYGRSGIIAELSTADNTGSTQVALTPSVWNLNSTGDYNLRIVESNMQPFMASLPAGPVFHITYNGQPTAADAASVKGNSDHPSISKGGIAAAVLVPIIFIALLVAGAFIKLSRAKGKEKTRRYSEAIDRRMSTISTGWNSITPAGASAAVRNSMAVPGNRASSFSFGGQIRPMTVVGEGVGIAGVGASGMGYAHGDPNMATIARPGTHQLREGVRASVFSERKSRAISFADDPRPSQDSRRPSQDSRRVARSRAFDASFAPPLPTRQESGELSPTQTDGPLTLTADDIRARLNNQDAAPRPSMDEVLPALSLMRNGGTEIGSDDSLLSPVSHQMPAPPTPTHQGPQLERTPVMGLMPMQTIPAETTFASPDDMLRAYASGNRAAPVNANGMRVLYGSSPQTPTAEGNSKRKSISTTYTEASRYSVYEYEDAYAATAK